MDYEKAYKDAIERMKSWARGEHPECFTEAQKAAEFIFPELKESADEKIRKTLIKFHKSTIDIDEIKGDDIVAWLEKQGNKPQGKTALEAIRKEKVDNAIKVEQKPYGQKEECFNCQFNYAGHCKGYCELKKQGEKKPIDKVEPKFKVHDWIKHNKANIIFQINKVTDNKYEFNNPDGYNHSLPIKSVDKKYHLWTIQDAKDGDILASDNSIFIFQEEYIAEKPTAYCGLMNGLFIEGNGACWTNEKCYPATKEQCDLLFQKIKEASYEWDVYKKELKKIKKTSKWSEEDEKTWCGIIDEIEANKSNAPDYDIETYDRFLSLLYNIKQMMEEQQ